MTPRGYHTLGSMNHLAILGSEYLELIAAAPGDDASRRDPGRAVRTERPGVWHQRIPPASIKHCMRLASRWKPPLEFSRPVELSDGRATRRSAPFD